MAATYTLPPLSDVMARALGSGAGGPPDAAAQIRSVLTGPPQDMTSPEAKPWIDAMNPRPEFDHRTAEVPGPPDAGASLTAYVKDTVPLQQRSLDQLNISAARLRSAQGMIGFHEADLAKAKNTFAASQTRLRNGVRGPEAEDALWNYNYNKADVASRQGELDWANHELREAQAKHDDHQAWHDSMFANVKAVPLLGPSTVANANEGVGPTLHLSDTLPTGATDTGAPSITADVTNTSTASGAIGTANIGASAVTTGATNTDATTGTANTATPSSAKATDPAAAPPQTAQGTGSQVASGSHAGASLDQQMGDFINRDEFKNQSPDDRLKGLHQFISDRHDELEKQNPDAAARARFYQAAAGAYQSAGAALDEKLGRLAKDAAVGVATTVGTTAAVLVDGAAGGMGGAAINKVIGDGKVRFGTGDTASLAAQGFVPGLKDYAGAAVGQIARAGGENAPLDKELGEMFQQLDQGTISPQDFTAWAQQHSAALQGHQAVLYAQDRAYGNAALGGAGGIAAHAIGRRLGLIGPAAVQEQDQKDAATNSLTSERNLPLLQEYCRTRAPALKEQLLDNLRQNPTQIRAQEEKKALAESDLGRGVENILRTSDGTPVLSAQNVIATGDPLNVAATAAIPLTGGLSEAAFTTRVLTSAATGAGMNTVQYLRDHPNASLGGTTQAALEGGGIGGVAHLVGEGAARILPPVVRAVSAAGGKVIDAGSKVLDAAGRAVDAAGRDLHETLTQGLDRLTNPNGPLVPAGEGYAPAPERPAAPAPSSADPGNTLQATGSKGSSGASDAGASPSTNAPESGVGSSASEPSVGNGTKLTPTTTSPTPTEVPSGPMAETFPGDFPELESGHAPVDFPEDAQGAEAGGQTATADNDGGSLVSGRSYDAVVSVDGEPYFRDANGEVHHIDLDDDEPLTKLDPADPEHARIIERVNKEISGEHSTEPSVESGGNPAVGTPDQQSGIQGGIQGGDAPNLRSKRPQPSAFEQNPARLKKPPGYATWGRYLEDLIGPSPEGMINPHAHHILFKKGLGAVQQALVEEGQAILRRHGIDPIYGKENLVWAPYKIAEQHHTSVLTHTVETLRAVEEAGGGREGIVAMLHKLGSVAAQRK